MVHKVTNIVHRQFRALDQFFSTSLCQRTAPEEASRPLTHHQTRKEEDPKVVREVFHSRNLEVDEADDKVQLTTFKVILKSREFVVSLAKNPPKMMVDMLLKAQKYMNTKDALTAIKDVEKTSEKGRKEDDRRRQKRERSDCQTNNGGKGKMKKLIRR